jgi:endoplasmic reticulum Man9GlcNAc2 1,2-alpha-mannosidase
MSFAVPQRLPDFNNHEKRQYENWNHAGRHGRANSAFTYKDKPFYGGVHPTRRHQWYKSKWVLLPLGIFAVFFILHHIYPGTQQEFEEELHRSHAALDWDQRRERVKEVFQYSWNGYVDHAWGKDEYRPISGSGRNMIPEGNE